MNQPRLKVPLILLIALVLHTAVMGPDGQPIEHELAGISVADPSYRLDQDRS